jgi:hypothetical protein
MMVGFGRLLLISGLVAVLGLCGCQKVSEQTSSDNPSSSEVVVYPDTDGAPVLSLVWQDADATLSGTDIYDDSRLEIHPFAHRWSEGELYGGSYHPYPEEMEIYFKSDSYYIPVYACAAGVVAEVVNNVTEYGQQIGVVEDYDVTIRYGRKYQLFYAHIASVEVVVDEQVEKGDVIGYVLPLNGYVAGYYELGVGQRTGAESGRYWNPYRFFDEASKLQLSALWDYVTGEVESRGSDYLSWDLTEAVALSANARGSSMSENIKTVFTSGEFPQDIEFWDSDYWTFIDTFNGIDWE